MPRVPRAQRRVRPDPLHRVGRRAALARRFYTEVLGGEVLMDGNPSIVALASSWNS
jgi:hypothetical protein